ncbi:MAG: 30S ribosomal protein S2 [Acidobacteriota bacterium]|nr:MAG: 30S ribosomal protein S2 [Acidobacteriota bacterium]
MPELSIQELLEAGAHFGHRAERWNPKVEPFIFDKRNGIHIIDLQRTDPLFQKACDFAREITAQGGNILFVGTKRQAQEVVIREARRCGMPYVAYRWVGGTLTNFGIIRRSIERLGEIETLTQGTGWERIPTKEQMDIRRQQEKLFRLYHGLREVNRMPTALFVLDAIRERIAVLEANRMGLPVIAILDTNCDPDLVQYPIPGNDDAIRSIQLFTSRFTDAVVEGLAERRDRSLEQEKRDTEKEEEEFYTGRSIALSRSLSLDSEEDLNVNLEEEDKFLSTPRQPTPPKGVSNTLDAVGTSPSPPPEPGQEDKDDAPPPKATTPRAEDGD